MKKFKLNKKNNRSVYRYWQALFMAFYYKPIYVDAIKRWKGFAFFYLLLLISVSSTPFSLRLMLQFHHYLTDNVLIPLSQIPPLILKQGEIQFDQTMPYFINNKKGEAVILIDTANDLTSVAKQYPSASMLIGKNKLYYRAPRVNLMDSKPVEPIIETFSSMDDEIFIAKDWIKDRQIVRLKWFFNFMIWPFNVSFLFGMFSSFVLVLTILGQTYAWLIFKCKLTFKQSCRMLVLSATPQQFLLYLGLMTPLSSSQVMIGSMILWLIYFSYAIVCVRREITTMVPV